MIHTEGVGPDAARREKRVAPDAARMKRGFPVVTWCGCEIPLGSLADEHWDGTCRRCGGTVDLSPSDPQATCEENDPARAGQRASRPVYFSDSARLSLFAVHTRGERVQWFGVDEQRRMLPDVSAVIVQSDDYAAAVRRMVDYAKAVRP